MRYIIAIFILMGTSYSLYSREPSKKDIKKFTKLIEKQDTIGASDFLSKHIELKENEVINVFFSLYEYQRLKIMFQENEVLRESVWKYIYREHHTELLKESIDELNRLYMSFQVCQDDIVSVASQLNYSDFFYGELDKMAQLEIFSDNNILKKKIESMQSKKIEMVLSRDVIEIAHTILHEEDTTMIPFVVEEFILPQLPAFSLQELAYIVPSFQGSTYYEEVLFEYQNKLEDLLYIPCDELISCVSSKLEKLLPQIQISLNKDMTDLFDEFLGGLNSLKNNIFKRKENTNKTFTKLWGKYNRQKHYSNLLNKEITSEFQNFIVNRNTFLKYFIDKDIKSAITDSVIHIKLEPSFRVMRNTVEENFSSVACDFGINVGGMAVELLFPPAAPYLFGFQLGWGIGDSTDEEDYFINNQTEYLYAQISVEIEAYLNNVLDILQQENARIITLIINKSK